MARVGFHEGVDTISSAVSMFYESGISFKLPLLILWTELNWTRKRNFIVCPHYVKHKCWSTHAINSWVLLRHKMVKILENSCPVIHPFIQRIISSSNPHCPIVHKTMRAGCYSALYSVSTVIFRLIRTVCYLSWRNAETCLGHFWRGCTNEHFKAWMSHHVLPFQAM